MMIRAAQNLGYNIKIQSDLHRNDDFRSQFNAVVELASFGAEHRHCLKIVSTENCAKMTILGADLILRTKN